MVPSPPTSDPTVRSFRLTPTRAAVLSGLYIVLWQSLVLAPPAEPLIALSGWVGAYLLGLAWAIYLLERAAQRIETRYALTTSHRRPQISVSGENASGRRGGWNPLDPAARYYGPVLGFLCFLICSTIFA